MNTLEGGYDYPTPPTFTFSTCTKGQHSHCRGHFYSAKRGRVECACECHVDDYVAYLERRAEA